MRKYFTYIATLTLILFLQLPVFSQKQVERIDRGAIAIKQSKGYMVSWRLLADEDYNTGFNIYRGSTKINSEPITNITSYFDQTTLTNSYYYVKAIVNNEEIENKKAALNINNTQGENAAYFDIPLNKPGTGENGGTYSPNDASTGDLNGDGEYDIVLKWDPSNSKDNSQKGITDNVFLDGYTLNGNHMWRIDLGPNIRAGAHYTQFLVYDFDGNGKAEIMVKTAPGTKDGSGNYIHKGPAASADHTKKYRNSNGYILSGPEYISVFDGETGVELATADYWPARGSVGSWGDSYGNRLDRYNATVAYVDGIRPSGVFQRGYYTRLTMAAWNWRDGKLTRVWTFDSNTSGNGKYAGQGNHSIHVIDANNDGLDDIVTGSSVISGTGEGMHTSGMGHGDACHVTYMEKGNNRPMIYMCHEDGNNGVSLRYADNGEMVFNNKKSGDIGRGCAAELDPQTPGFKYWGASSMGIYNIEGKDIGDVPSSINFVIWWNGELSRELMNSNRIDQWSVKFNSGTRLLTADGTSSNNGTKSTPTLQADLFGDWREEVILRMDNNNALRVFTTTMPTTYKLYTLMHDPVYRCQVSAQNSSYNQPPHPGFYLATDMDFPQAAPNVLPLAGVYRGSGEIIKNLTVGDLQNAYDWEIASGLSETSAVYGNVTMFPSPLPDYLSGSEWIKTSTESRKWNESEPLASFEVTKDAVISVAISAEITKIPMWLDGYKAREEAINVSSPLSGAKPMVIYEKSFLKGEKVNLGTNTIDADDSKQMYFVIARENTQTSIKETTANTPLLKVSPNPFNHSCTIEYNLEKSQNISLKMYDLNGKLYSDIDNGIKEEGTNKVKVDGKSFSNGVYFIMLKTADFILQEKIMVTH